VKARVPEAFTYSPGSVKHSPHLAAHDLPSLNIDIENLHMSKSFEPSITEMQVELQVLTRAVSTLFVSHPNPEALRAAWSTVMNDLKPRDPGPNATDLEKNHYEIQCAEYRLASQLKARIGE